MIENICSSCGDAFTNEAPRRFCPYCVGLRGGIRPMMIDLMKDVVTAKAKEMAKQVWRLFDQGKYLAATKMTEELGLQIKSDQREYQGRQQNKAAKKVRHAQNQERTRQENRQRSKSGAR